MVQGQVEWDPGQPDLRGVISALGAGLVTRRSSNPSHSVIQCFYDSLNCNLTYALPPIARQKIVQVTTAINLKQNYSYFQKIFQSNQLFLMLVHVYEILISTLNLVLPDILLADVFSSLLAIFSLLPMCVFISLTLTVNLTFIKMTSTQAWFSCHENGGVSNVF